MGSGIPKTIQNVGLFIVEVFENRRENRKTRKRSVDILCQDRPFREILTSSCWKSLTSWKLLRLSNPLVERYLRFANTLVEDYVGLANPLVEKRESPG